MSSMPYKNSPIFALVDCNNFYASCERLFNPKLIGKPIIILSSNDGCVISRSNEAKALDIKMGEPFFKIKSLCDRKKVKAFSSNFALYGDISNRVMSTLTHLCPDIEIYSIDEAFLRLDKMVENPYDYARKIRQKIWQNIGIPVSIGIAPTKTLAKVASHLAKKNVHYEGVCDLRYPDTRKYALLNFSVEDIWGVGRKSAQYLKDFHIHTAFDLCNTPDTFLKKRFSVRMKRIALELQGVPCLYLEEVVSKQTITCSRSFGKAVEKIEELLQAISVYTARACEKAREEKSKARYICVYVRTSFFNPSKPFDSGSYTQLLEYPSNDTCYINSVAHTIIKKIYKPGFAYQKAGIILGDLIQEKPFQQNLFSNNDDNKNLMKVVDDINQHFTSPVFFAAEGIEPEWSVKSMRKSPRYTTHWGELPVVVTNSEHPRRKAADVKPR